MADISKCFGTGCPVKEKCYRYTVPANEFRQTYAEYWKHLPDCGYFWDAFWRNENELISIAEQHPDDNEANNAMAELRERFDKTYKWCMDCDGIVCKEKDCCLNK